VRVIDEISEDGQKISSTAVKQFLEKGDIESVNRFLGYTYHLEGSVVHGLQNGRKMGFPTANIELDPQLILPQSGVYAGYGEAEGELYRAMINLGSNPTVSESSRLHLETHLIGIEEDLYGQRVRLYFTKRLRSEITFNSLKELREQLLKDRETITKTSEQVYEF